MFFGNKLRQLREKKGLLLRQIAAALEVDTATVSKIERGDRQAKEEQLQLFSKILETDIEELKTLWVADQIYQVANRNKDQALQALQIAEKELSFAKSRTQKNK